MKQILTIIISVCFCAYASAQNYQSSTDDFGRLALTPVIVEDSGVPANAANILKNKMTQMVTRSGLAADSPAPRFVITASVDPLYKETTATTPPMVALKVVTTLYIGDAETGQIFGTYAFNESKGVGTNETKAYIEATKSIRTNDPGALAFIEESKIKIIEYYNSQIDFIIAEARSLAGSDRYDDAIVLLSSVPTVCKDAHAKAMETIAEIFQEKIDVEGMALYNEAVATWKTGKTQDNAYAVVDILTAIHPNSKSFTRSMTLVTEIEGFYSELESRRRAIEQRNWDFKMQQYADKQMDDDEQRILDHEVNLKKAESSAMLVQEVKGIISAMPARKGNGLFSKVSSWFK